MPAISPESCELHHTLEAPTIYINQPSLTLRLPRRGWPNSQSTPSIDAAFASRDTPELILSQANLAAYLPYRVAGALPRLRMDSDGSARRQTTARRCGIQAYRVKTLGSGRHQPMNELSDANWTGSAACRRHLATACPLRLEQPNAAHIARQIAGGMTF
jgi:hypothetical protein